MTAAGGATAVSAGGSAVSSAPSASPTAAAATVRTAPEAVGGKTETILVNARGLPLYVYRPDTAAKSRVTGALAQLWPPLTLPAPTAAGVNGKLTVLNDANGHQVTYNGHPLYTFARRSPRPGNRPGLPELLRGHTRYCPANHGLSASGNGTCRPVGRPRLLTCARAPGDRPEDAGRQHHR